MFRILMSILVAFCIRPVDLRSQVADSTSRKVPVIGAVNFRDLGGYQTWDGKTVKWGRIYRAAELSRLSIEDLEILRRRNISRDLDFRGPFEVAKAPDRIPTGCLRVSLPAGSEHVGDSTYLKKMLSGSNGDSTMVHFYADISSFRERYGPMFRELLALPDDSALVFHCTAGKDRTGIGAALVLFALGVDERTIMADYLASNIYRKTENERAIEAMSRTSGMDTTIARAMLEVKPIYLQSTLKAIRSKYESVGSFLINGLGLTADDLKKLQAKYLN
jgi:protein-tyrosine phosphatase